MSESLLLLSKKEQHEFIFIFFQFFTVFQKLYRFYWSGFTTQLVGGIYFVFPFFKGSVSRNFWPPFFSWFEPIYSRPLINRLKYFWIRFRFPRDIQIFKKHCGVHPTAESDSTVCVIPRSLTLQCASHCGVKWSKFFEKLCGVHPTAKSNSAVYIPPWSQVIKFFRKAPRCAMCILLPSLTPRCASHHWVKLHGVHHTAESDSAVCIPPPSQFLPSVHFDLKFYKCNFSLMSKDINVKIIL